eukprot:TRINITY_DN2486_c0_g1_i1.p1 TRINITY_DN2486_c0_g1~~TRINITY_DN2486_c0_g1_i1.p1  ORF type:complete len:190 (-),score=31.41 TRINITY_DN2486_c0_g1_i1:64-633(-)
MGCNGSKNEDIAQSRPRMPPQQDPHRGGYSQGPITREPSKIPTSSAIKPIAGQQGPSNVPDVSYSQKRQEDQEALLKNLLEKTSANLIDVSQTTAGLDAMASESRMKDYKERQAVQSAMSVASSFKVAAFALPAASASNSSPAAVLAHKSEAREHDFPSRVAAKMASSVKKMEVEDCGEIVVPFGSMAT